MASFFSDLGKTFQNAAQDDTEENRGGYGSDPPQQRAAFPCAMSRKSSLPRWARLTIPPATARAARSSSTCWVRRIDELAERIEAVTAEIDALNDKKRCPGCGAVVDLDAKFCPSCGAKMPAPKQPEPEEAPEAPRAEYCPGCGALRQGEARFCAVCGQPFASEEAKSEDAPKPEVEIHWPEASAEEPPVEEPAQDGDEQP